MTTIDCQSVVVPPVAHANIQSATFAMILLRLDLIAIVDAAILLVILHLLIKTG